ncbi:PAS domain-containing sensor histidine kinase [Granulosicoccaceae sp. 1_MG-2023]|nr:PAS domain-containing sensor histidine kinase [Granulosicoccaceae sp. 1_MG-2023]
MALLLVAALCSALGGVVLVWQLFSTGLTPAPALSAFLCLLSPVVMLMALSGLRRTAVSGPQKAPALVAGVASLTGIPAQALQDEAQQSVAVARLKGHLHKLTEQKKVLTSSTRVLAYQKSNAESILRSMPEGVLVLESTGKVTFANQQFLRWYRLQPAEVLGKRPQDWCERDELAAFLNRFCGSLARRAERAPLDRDPPGKPGAFLSATALPMFSARDEGVINNTLIVFSDVTAEVNAQAARDEFATALAHELKTPLHAIGLQAELLLGEDGEDDSMRVEAANFIQQEVDHVGELVRNMLNITRIETGSLAINRKLTKITDLINNAIDNLEAMAADQHVVIQRHLPDSMEASYLDKDLLRVAINNLLSNAIKYNKPGGEVRVYLNESDAHMILTVEDTGLGIDESERAHVFDKFFRSEDSNVRERSGHGLGLSLVREIIELHNGTISLESEKGRGSTFTIRLKRMSVPLQEAA